MYGLDLRFHSRWQYLRCFCLSFYGELVEKSFFESMASYIAVVALTVVLYWMAFKEHLKSEIEQRIESLRTPIALVGFTFAMAFREVLEIVLFLIPFFVRDLIGTIRGYACGYLCSNWSCVYNVSIEYETKFKVLLLFYINLVSFCCKWFSGLWNP